MKRSVLTNVIYIKTQKEQTLKRHLFVLGFNYSRIDITIMAI